MRDAGIVRARHFMTRKLVLFSLLFALALGGCDKVKLPTFGRKKAAATPAPAVVEMAPASTKKLGAAAEIGRASCRERV